MKIERAQDAQKASMSTTPSECLKFVKFTSSIEQCGDWKYIILNHLYLALILKKYNVALLSFTFPCFLHETYSDHYLGISLCCLVFINFKCCWFLSICSTFKLAFNLYHFCRISRKKRALQSYSSVIQIQKLMIFCYYCGACLNTDLLIFFSNGCDLPIFTLRLCFLDTNLFSTNFLIMNKPGS